MEFKDWNVLSFLNTLTEPCLSFDSTCLKIDPNFTFLCGLGLLLLFLCYLMGIPFPTWKTKPTQKRQGRAKRRRKGGTLKDYRCYQREVEETRKLISVLSPLGRHHDTIHFRQLLCPDSSCEVCNSTTAEINRLLFPEALQDAPPLATTAPVTSSSFTLSPDSSAVPPGELISTSLPELSPPPASNFSPNPVIPVANFFPPSPPGDSLPPEPLTCLDSKSPVDHFPPQPLAFPPLPPLDAQTADPVVQTEATLSLNTIFSLDPTLSQDINPLPDLSQPVNHTETVACHHAPPTMSASPPPDCSLTVTKSKSISISTKPVSESSSPDSPSGLSTSIPKITGTDHSRLSILDFPGWQTHAKGFFPSTLAPCDFHQEFLALHSSEASSRGDPAANFVEPGNLSLLSPDGLALLEKQVQKRSDVLMWQEMKKGSFPKQTTADKHDLAASLPFRSSKDQSKELHMHQQPPYPTTLEEGHLQQTPIQLFWGLPTLHSESLFSAAHVSDDCSSIFIFNRISNASTEQESPVVPHPLPLSLPENQPQLLTQTQAQSQPPPIPQVQPQAHLQSPLPILPSCPLPQIKICGVCYHRPQNQSESLMSTEMQHLEWNVLQKEQESMWGLPTVVQRSQEDFCPSAPNPSLNRRASQAHVAICILPGQFPLSDELRTKLERHLRKRLIQHRWGMPRRIYESLSLMTRPSNFSEIPESQHYRGRTWISKSQSKLSASESIYEGGSDILQLEDDDLEKDDDQKDNNDPEKDNNDLEKDNNDLEKDNNDKNLTVSVETAGQRQLENALKKHLSKKLEEISEGRLPGTVHNSWHSMKQALLLSEKSHTEVKQKSLSPSVVEDYSLNTFQELPFVESSAQQMLEAHIERFRKRMTWGLPPRVLESIELFKSIEATSRSSFSSSSNLISEVNSKPGSFNSLRGSSKYLHGDKEATANSAPILDRPLPATSTVGKEEQRIPRQSPSDINQEFAGDVQKIKDGRQTCTPVKHDTVGNRWPPKLPARQTGARQEPKDKSANSSGRGGMQQGKKMKNLEPAVVPTVSREIFRAKELDAHQSQFNILTTSKPGSSQIVKVNENKVKTTVPIKPPPPNISIPQDPKSSTLKEQLLHELKLKLENRKHSQAQAQCTGLPPAADTLTYKASLTHAQGVSTGDMGASQVLHVHSEDTGINREQQQEPWVPRHVLRKCQNNLPPAVMTMSPRASKAKELGGGDAGLGTSQLRRNSFHPTEDVALKKRFPTRDVVLKEKLESKPSQTLSQMGQPPSESLFRKKMKHFLQWLNPGIKCKKQENFQEKGSPLSSVESRGLLKGRTAFTGTTKAQKITPDVGKFLEEKMRCRHAVDSTCPRQPIPSPIKFGKTQQKAQVWAQAQPVQGYPLNYRAPSYRGTNTKSCHQEVVCAGQGHTGSIRQIRDQYMPQKAVAFKDQLLHQKYPLSMAHREPAPHPNTTCRHQAGQGPRVTLTTAEGTEFRELSQLFRQKTLLQNFQEGIFPTPK